MPTMGLLGIVDIDYFVFALYSSDIAYIMWVVQCSKEKQTF